MKLTEAQIADMQRVLGSPLTDATTRDLINKLLNEVVDLRRRLAHVETAKGDNSSPT